MEDSVQRKITPKKLVDSKFAITIIRAEKLTTTTTVESNISDPICFVWCGPPKDIPNLDKLQPERK